MVFQKFRSTAHDDEEDEGVFEEGIGSKVGGSGVGGQREAN
jgi:hypothetical protein